MTATPKASALRVGAVAKAPVAGGAEAYLRGLYRVLPEFGIDGELLGDVARWDDSGRPAHGLPLGPKWSRRTALRGLLRAPGERRAATAVVASLHGERPFALFHAQYKREQILLSRPLSALAPVLWTEQGRFPDRRGTAPLRAAYARAARSAGAIVCVSDDVRDDVAAICGDRGPRLEVIPNPVDTRRFRPPTADERAEARRALGVPDIAAPVFVTSGRLHPSKRIDLAIAAASATAGAHLLVAGDGPDRARLEQIADGHSVIFTGALERPELVYAAGDCFVLPSSSAAREGLSLAMLEAAASGLPVVTVAGSGMEHHASAGGGQVADPDAGSLRDALERAVAARSQRPRDWAAGFDLRICARRHADLMRDLVAERSDGAGR